MEYILKTNKQIQPDKISLSFLGEKLRGKKKVRDSYLNTQEHDV